MRLKLEIERKLPLHLNYIKQERGNQLMMSSSVQERETKSQYKRYDYTDPIEHPLNYNSIHGSTFPSSATNSRNDSTTFLPSRSNPMNKEYHRNCDRPIRKWHTNSLGGSSWGLSARGVAAPIVFKSDFFRKNPHCKNPISASSSTNSAKILQSWTKRCPVKEQLNLAPTHEIKSCLVKTKLEETPQSKDKGMVFKTNYSNLSSQSRNLNNPNCNRDLACEDNFGDKNYYARKGDLIYHYDLDSIEEKDVNKDLNANELNCHEYLTKDDNEFESSMKIIGASRKKLDKPHPSVKELLSQETLVGLDNNEFGEYHIRPDQYLPKGHVTYDATSSFAYHPHTNSQNSASYLSSLQKFQSSKSHEISSAQQVFLRTQDSESKPTSPCYPLPQSCKSKPVSRSSTMSACDLIINAAERIAERDGETLPSGLCSSILNEKRTTKPNSAQNRNFVSEECIELSSNDACSFAKKKRFKSVNKFKGSCIQENEENNFAKDEGLNRDNYLPPTPKDSSLNVGNGDSEKMAEHSSTLFGPQSSRLSCCTSDESYYNSAHQSHPVMQSSAATSAAITILHANKLAGQTKPRKKTAQAQTNYIAERTACLVRQALDSPAVTKQFLLSMALKRENPRLGKKLPSLGTIIHDRFYWGQFPPLECVLRSNMEEYYDLSIKECQSRAQQTFNNKLVAKIRGKALECGWSFDRDQFDDKKIRDRVRCFFKTHIQNAKKRLQTMVKNPTKKANAKALASLMEIIEKCNDENLKLKRIRYKRRWDEECNEMASDDERDSFAENNNEDISTSNDDAEVDSLSDENAEDDVCSQHEMDTFETNTSDSHSVVNISIESRDIEMDEKTPKVRCDDSDTQYAARVVSLFDRFRFVHFQIPYFIINYIFFFYYDHR